ncbi:MAG TPA: hypothetical protein VFW33_08565 [Gemmataceae bacterium]|nr:hypothetical protein [Gemmataceae bacterium]
MPERSDTPPEMRTIPLAQRGTDATAGGSDSSPHDTEPHSVPEAPPDEQKQQPSGGNNAYSRPG